MTLDQLLKLQEENGASVRLIAHHQVVATIARQIANKVSQLGVGINKAQIIFMAAIHDIGKIKVAQELFETGSKHEQIGFEFARDLGIPDEIANMA